MKDVNLTLTFDATESLIKVCDGEVELYKGMTLRAVEESRFEDAAKYTKEARKFEDIRRAITSGRYADFMKAA